MTKGKDGKEGADPPIRTLADTHLWKKFAKLREKHAGENREDVTLVIANKLTLGVEDAWYVWRALDPGLRDASLRNPDLDDLNLDARERADSGAKSWIVNALDPKAHLSKDEGKVMLSLPHRLKIPPDLVEKIKALRTTGARHFSWGQDANDLDAPTRAHFVWLDYGGYGRRRRVAELAGRTEGSLKEDLKDYKKEWERAHGGSGVPLLKEAIDGFRFREWHEGNMREWQEQNHRSIKKREQK